MLSSECVGENKNTYLLGYYTGNSASVQVLEHLALLFPAVYLLAYCGGVFFLPDPSSPSHPSL